MVNIVTYGFQTLQDRFGRRVTEVGVDVVFGAITTTVEEYNRQVNFLLGDLTERTQLHKRLFRTMGVARLQPADADTRALPVKTGAAYTVGWPITRGRIAWGQGWEASLRLTVEEANENTRLMIAADAAWMRDQIFAGIFNDTAYTFTDEQWGATPVLPIANGDAQTYYITGGAVDPITATHFHAQLAAIADGATNPFTLGASTLRQYPENTGEVYALVPTNLVASIQGLTNFRGLNDINIIPGNADARLARDPGIVTPGRLIGYLEDDMVWIYQWLNMPSGYIIMRAQGSPAPLAMREDDIAELQGFRQIGTRADFPWDELHYQRKVGFGALNRTAAYIIRIGSDTYAPPAGYALPVA